MLAISGFRLTLALRRLIRQPGRPLADRLETGTATKKNQMSNAENVMHPSFRKWFADGISARLSSDP